jgi:hypothetical protein
MTPKNKAPGADNTEGRAKQKPLHNFKCLAKVLTIAMVLFFMAEVFK